MKAVRDTAFVSLVYLGILLMAPLVEAEARASELSPEAYGPGGEKRGYDETHKGADGVGG